MPTGANYRNTVWSTAGENMDFQHHSAFPSTFRCDFRIVSGWIIQITRTTTRWCHFFHWLRLGRWRWCWRCRLHRRSRNHWCININFACLNRSLRNRLRCWLWCHLWFGRLLNRNHFRWRWWRRWLNNLWWWWSGSNKRNLNFRRIFNWLYSIILKWRMFEVYTT